MEFRVNIEKLQPRPAGPRKKKVIAVYNPVPVIEISPQKKKVDVIKKFQNKKPDHGLPARRIIPRLTDSDSAQRNLKATRAKESDE